MKKPEYELSKAISIYLKMQYPDVLFHFDLAGLNLSRAQAGMNKAIQKARGYPDLHILDGRGQYKGLFIELKKGGFNIKKKDGNFVNDHVREQAEMLILLRMKGYRAEFGIGFEQTKKIIDDYFGK